MEMILRYNHIDERLTAGPKERVGLMEQPSMGRSTTCARKTEKPGRAHERTRARAHTHMTHANTLSRREGGGGRNKGGGGRAEGAERMGEDGKHGEKAYNPSTQIFQRNIIARTRDIRGGICTDGDAGGLAAAGSDGRLPHSVAEEEGHEDLADEGRHAAVGRVDDVGAQVGGHVHFAREDHCEDDGAEQAARHLGYEIGLEGGGAGIIWQMALLEYIMSDRH